MSHYNRVEQFHRALRSILHQSFQNFEVLLICDGCTSEALEAALEYKHHPKVRIIRYLNNSGGPIRGRNKGFKEAKGVYVALMDTDDVADVDRLKRSVEYAEKYHADVIYGSWRARLDGTRPMNDVYDGQEVFSPDVTYQQLKNGNALMNSTVMIRTEALRKVGGVKPWMERNEDWELYLRLRHHGYRFKTVPHVLIDYWLHQGNLELKFIADQEEWNKKMNKEFRKLTTLFPTIVFFVKNTEKNDYNKHVFELAQYLLINKKTDVLILSATKNNPVSWLDKFPVTIVHYKETAQIPQYIDLLLYDKKVEDKIKTITLQKKFVLDFSTDQHTKQVEGVKGEILFLEKKSTSEMGTAVFGLAEKYKKTW